MHSAVIALAATMLYAHGTCAVAPQTAGSVPTDLTTAAAAANPSVTLAAVRVGTAPRRQGVGGHCSLAALPFAVPPGTRVVAYVPGPSASASDDVPTPWGCYALPPRAHRAAGDGLPTACAPFPAVDALPETNPFL
jgi:hypothetical protein